MTSRDPKKVNVVTPISLRPDISVFRIRQRGGVMASAQSASLSRGSGGGTPSEVQGQSLKLKHFLLLNVQWKPQIRPFFLKFVNAKIHQTLSNFAILAGKWQNAPFHIKSPVKNCHGRAKGEGHRTPPP